MTRIEYFLQQLVKLQAHGIEFESGKPLRLRFPTGDKFTASPIDHAQVQQVLKDAGQPAAIDELQLTGKTQLRYRSTSGAEYQLEAVQLQPNVWKLGIVAAGALGAVKAAAAAGQGRAAPEPIPVPGLGGGASSASSASNAGPQAPAPKPQGLPQLSDLAQPKPPAPQAPAPQAAPVAASAAKPEPPAAAASHHEHGVTAEVTLEPGEPRINEFMRIMMKVGGSDLHMSSNVVPMIRVHGEMTPIANKKVLSHDELFSILAEIAPERNRQEFEEKNDTDFAHSIPGLARFRANYFRDQHGIGAVFRQIPFTILTPEKLGVPPKVLDLCWLTKGLVVVTGPTGSGKSTTLAALIDFINSNRSDHLITIEDPIEFVHQNKKCLVNQREIGTHTMSFKNALRAALREDPDIVLVGEMRDLETIAIAIETAETGHLVFGTLHTTTAPSTVDRIIDQFPADRQEQIRTMLSESLKGVIAQVLCKKKGGGRVAAYEILIGTSAVSNLIREGKTFQLMSVMQTNRHLGMQTMNDHLLQLVKQGLVEPNEAYMKAVDKHGLKDAFAKNDIPITL
jgi:twitching motility protein PilT